MLSGATRNVPYVVPRGWKVPSSFDDLMGSTLTPTSTAGESYQIPLRTRARTPCVPLTESGEGRVYGDPRVRATFQTTYGTSFVAHPVQEYVAAVAPSDTY